MYGFEDKIFCDECIRDTTGIRSIKKLRREISNLEQEAPEIIEYTKKTDHLKSLEQESWELTKRLYYLDHA